MKVAFYTLGCKVNQNDSSGLTALFTNKGYQIVPFQKGADIYVINTCTVTEVSNRKSAQAIRRAVGLTPGAIVVVTGCYAQTAPQKIAGIPGVDLVVGMAERPKIVELTEKIIASREKLLVAGDMTDAAFWSVQNFEGIGRTRATLKIEEGCEQFCSYCIVPYARGRVKSQPPELVKQDFSRFLMKGFKEIVLTGIHLGSYGRDLDITLFDLLRELVLIPGDFRIRLGSIEPNDLFDSFIHFVTSCEKICQYLHIPLQSGSDHILKRMNRGYDTAGYADLLTKIRDRNPLMAIGTDVITGFPGETEAYFEVVCDFIIKQNFSRIHVFRFSPRPGTKAAGFSEPVSQKTKETRSAIIRQIAERSATKYARQFIGKPVRVLFEEREGDGWSGLSGEYLRVWVGSKQDLKNSLQPVFITGGCGSQLTGKLQL